MKLYIYPNTTAKRYIDKLQVVMEKLQLEHECSMNPQDSLTIYKDISYDRFPLEECDIIVSLGGDGTFLRAVQLALGYDKPVYGINCGRLGYLCRHDHDDYDLSDLKEDIAPLLEFENGGKTYYALNDVVVGKDYFGGTVELGLELDGEAIYDFMGDGFIVSTPLGSTGYNHSAGGMIIYDVDDQFSLMPICPTDRAVGQLIIDDRKRITVRSLSRSYSASIYYDGQYAGRLNEITITKSKKTVRILR